MNDWRTRVEDLIRPTGAIISTRPGTQGGMELSRDLAPIYTLTRASRVNAYSTPSHRQVFVLAGPVPVKTVQAWWEHDTIRQVVSIYGNAELTPDGTTSNIGPNGKKVLSSFDIADLGVLPFMIRIMVKHGLLDTVVTRQWKPAVTQCLMRVFNACIENGGKHEGWDRFLGRLLIEQMGEIGASELAHRLLSTNDPQMRVPFENGQNRGTLHLTLSIFWEGQLIAGFSPSNPGRHDLETVLRKANNIQKR